MSPKYAAINIRVLEELKDSLQKIAKKKDTSLNDVTSTVLAEFVENYELEQVKNDEIPSAAEAKKLVVIQREKNLQEALNLVKSRIKEMIDDAGDYTSVAANEIENLFYDEIISELKKLNYSTYVVRQGIADHRQPKAMHNKDDILISYDERTISQLVSRDDGMPF